jgi:heat shock protein HtpX
MNNVKVFGLLAGMTALFGAIGFAIAGQGGMVTALVLATLMNVFMYFNSGKMVLKMYRARVISEQDAPELFRMVDRLRQRAGLPMPTVAIAPHPQPNAFATGRDYEHAVVCVTEGLLDVMGPRELEGVIAHELAHIRNRDMLLQTVTATLAAAITNIAYFGMFFGGGDEEGGGNPLAAIGMMILAPMAAGLIQMAISRQREFKDDAVGAEIAGSPEGLASALLTLEAGAQRIPMQVSPAAAPLAQVNPLSAMRGGGVSKLFSTHPPTEVRVARLRALRAA